MINLLEKHFQLFPMALFNPALFGPDGEIEALSTMTILADKFVFAAQHGLDQLQTIVRRARQISDDLFEQRLLVFAVPRVRGDKLAPA